MFEHLYPPQDRDHLAELRSRAAPLGCYVSFRERMRERVIAGVVGILLGAAGAALLYSIGVV